MLRASYILLLLVSVPLPRAEATEQIPERFVVDGRVHRLRWVEPLKAKLAEFEKNPFPVKADSSALWRGYVGTWLIEGNALYLHSLVRYEYEEGEPRGVPIPLTAIVPGGRRWTWRPWTAAL